eukprot:scaffold119785_cov43-Cyclotella_meneghiniana.AAC.1
MHSNLNHASSFNIHTMRHWDSQGGAVMVWDSNIHPILVLKCTDIRLNFSQTVKVLQLWFGDSNTLNLGVEMDKFNPQKCSLTLTEKPLWTIYFNLNYALPFNIHIMRHWTSQGAAVMGKNNTATYVDHRPTTNDPLSLVDHIATSPRPQEMRNVEKLEAIILFSNR